MAAGSDGLISFTLIGGKTVSLNVNHIVSIETLTTKELRTLNFRKYGSSNLRDASISKILMSSGKAYITTSGTSAEIITDTRATVAKGGITGGKF